MSATTFAPVPVSTGYAVASGPNRARTASWRRAVHGSSPYEISCPALAAASAARTSGWAGSSCPRRTRSRAQRRSAGRPGRARAGRGAPSVEEGRGARPQDRAQRVKHGGAAMTTNPDQPGTGPGSRRSRRWSRPSRPGRPGPLGAAARPEPRRPGPRRAGRPVARRPRPAVVPGSARSRRADPRLTTWADTRPAADRPPRARPGRAGSEEPARPGRRDAQPAEPVAVEAHLGAAVGCGLDVVRVEDVDEPRLVGKAPSGTRTTTGSGDRLCSVTIEASCQVVRSASTDGSGESSTSVSPQPSSGHSR